ncbi:hypothetical protein OS493_031775 [Desmophyllum pertusum]|uniref:Uncharacterized protein n=1 Tax=Desmophyllum pertusum TaxID=174260 RepID=A0A9W9Z8J1_9CNID|nr:hypothetical protein OS493_031775 [Desmophyllum pertusum]
MLGIPVMPGQSGQSELENDQETDTTWEMIYPYHDVNYCIDQDEAKNVICQQTQTSSTEGNTNDGTLVMKLRMRNGSILLKEKDAVWNEKWRLPDRLLAELSEKWKNVAEAELEIYHVEEKDAIRVEVKDTSKNPLLPAKTSSTEGNSKDGTLVMKLRMRNGSILFKEKDAVWNEKWKPPDGLLEELSEKWVNVAEGELEIYHMKEKGAILVEIKDTSKNSPLPAMVVNVFNAFFRSCLRGSETDPGEMAPDEPQIDWPDLA